jgi:hypothetical protein
VCAETSGHNEVYRPSVLVRRITWHVSCLLLAKVPGKRQIGPSELCHGGCDAQCQRLYFSLSSLERSFRSSATYGVKKSFPRPFFLCDSSPSCCSNASVYGTGSKYSQCPNSPLDRYLLRHQAMLMATSFAMSSLEGRLSWPSR